MSYSFDIDSKIIQLTNKNDLDLKDLYSSWKLAVGSSIAGAEQALRVVKEPLVGSTFIGPYYFIMNNWQIRPFDAPYVLEVSGTVVKDSSQTLDQFKIDDLNNIVTINQVTAVDVQVAEVRAALTQAQQDHLFAIPTSSLDQADISAIRAKTDNLPADPASETSVNAVVDRFLDEII